MFGDTFDTPEDLLYGNEGQVSNYLQRRARNCADLMNLPELQRERHFAGLKNQGATCYLNSLIQSFYMSPEFRNVILSLPLCGDSIDTPTNLLDDPEKHHLLLEFQKLFIKLKHLQSRSVSTEELTKSFGWNANEQLIQQDVSEANKVMFDAVDKALFGTPYNIILHYKGAIFNHITCLECQFQHGYEEPCFDFNLTVQGHKSLQEAIFAFITPECLDGNNQYFCDLCNKKVDALKGQKIRKIPRILQLSLNRFSFNYETMQRFKVNDRFEFPLELDMGPYIEEEAQNLIYDLTAVIIHRGNAHGGHYHAYFRDLLDEADWNILMADFWQEKEQELLKSQSDGKEKTNKNEKDIDQNLIDYDNVDFPMQSTNPAVYKNWFDFNDATVTSIPLNRIQSQFQGSESAYILLYRDRSLPIQKEINVPKYLIDHVDSLNVLLQQERDVYEEAKNYINIQVSEEDILNFNSRQLKEDKYPFKEHKMRLTQKVGELFVEGMTLLEFVENPNTKLIQFIRFLQNPDKTLQEEQVTHDSQLIYVKDITKIEHLVGVEKIPFKIKLLFNKKQISFLIFTSTTLKELKQLIKQETGIAEEIQQLKNLSNQQIISSLIDETTIADLKLGAETQIMITPKNEKLQQQQQQQQQQNKQEEQPDDIISVLVERDDEYGCVRYYVSLDLTVQELLDFLKDSMNLNDQRRLRRLNGNQLFCKSELNEQLKNLNFADGGIRLCLEKGAIPESGQIAIRVKLQSKYSQSQLDIQDIHCDPILTTVGDLKQQICTNLALESGLHRLYQTDWCEDPVQGLSDEQKSIAKIGIRERDLLILCDMDAQVQCDLNRFQIYLTKSGLPEDQLFQTQVTIKRDSTVMELKQMVVKTLDLQVGIERVRVREINKFYFFGQTLKKMTQQLKKIQFKTNNLVVQVLDHDEELKDNEMLLTLKLRNVEKRMYDEGRDFLFKCQKNPKLSDLKQQIGEFLGVDYGTMELAKFQIHEFQWLHLTSENLNKNFKLSEGEFIGCRIGKFDDDDFQTLEDMELRKKMIEAKKRKFKDIQMSKGKEDGFALNLKYLQQQ